MGQIQHPARIELPDKPETLQEMRVSVIIPVYCAAKYIREAVESALIQPEVAEIILVEDASPDNSLDICQLIAAEQPIVHLHRHPGGINRGPGASRNLAIQKSTCDFIAFLDADDYYLPNRFIVAKELFGEDPSIDGVYEAVANKVENETGEHRRNIAGLPFPQITSVNKVIPSENLFTALHMDKIGGVHLDGLVIKRNVAKKADYFDAELILHQDTAFIIKAAAISRLVPGRMDAPVAVYRIHERNRISAPRSRNEIYQMKINFRYSLWKWGRDHLGSEQNKILVQALINEVRSRQRFNRAFPQRLLWIQNRIQLMLLCFDHPGVVVERAVWQAFFAFYPGRIINRGK
jgi:glycosyltransferase involved in cell wall biosynthesis